MSEEEFTVEDWTSYMKSVRNMSSGLAAHQSLSRCTYKLPVLGWGFLHPDVAFVGQNPGKDGAQRTGVSFYGDASGDFFYSLLKEFFIASGIRPYVTNIVKENFNEVVPPAKLVNSKSVPEKAVDFWKPVLFREMYIVKPAVIVALGQTAAANTRKDFTIRHPAWALYSGNKGEYIKEFRVLAGKITVPLTTYGPTQREFVSCLTFEQNEHMAKVKSELYHQLRIEEAVPELDGFAKESVQLHSQVQDMAPLKKIAGPSEAPLS
jgi:uracil-DNA glycosylase family 4